MENKPYNVVGTIKIRIDCEYEAESMEAAVKGLFSTFKQDYPLMWYVESIDENHDLEAYKYDDVDYESNDSNEQ
jgi:hypothetical protein